MSNILQIHQKAGYSYKPQILVLEATALFSLLKEFTILEPDRSLPAQEYLEALRITPLEALLEKVPPVIDRVVITDLVFNEATGIMPASQPGLVKKLTALKDNPEELRAFIHNMVRASPRTGNRASGSNVGLEVARLLYFIAHHPESLVATSIGESYQRATSIELGALSGVSKDPGVRQARMDQYHLTRQDAEKILGKNGFDAHGLRVHLTNLHLCGIIGEDKYRALMRNRGRVGDNDKRFITGTEYLKLIGYTGENPLPNPKATLTMGDFEQYSALMPMKDKHRRYTNDETAASAKMLIEHYLFGGIFPPQERINIAEYLGFQAPDRGTVTLAELQNKQMLTTQASAWLEASEAPPEVKEQFRHLDKTHPEASAAKGQTFWQALKDGQPVALLDAMRLGMIDYDGYTEALRQAGLKPESINYALHEQGFFELCPAIKEIRNILKHYEQDSRFDGARKLVSAASLENIIERSRESFDDSCRSQQSYQKTPYRNDDFVLPDIGFSFERIFTNGLINGQISPQEYMGLILNTHSLRPHNEDPNRYYNPDGDVILQVDRQHPEQSVIKVEQSGFHCRTGNMVLRLSQATDAQPYPGADNRQYSETTLGEIIDLCRRSKGSADVPKYHRILDALLFPAVTKGASHVREVAGEMLGNERLEQMESDSFNWHKRDWKRDAQEVPSFRSKIFTLHRFMRYLGYDDGELASLEAALSIPNAQVWLANHDGFLDKTADEKAKFRSHLSISPMTMRLKPEHCAFMREAQDQLQQRSRSGDVAQLDTTPFLDSLKEWMGQPRKPVNIKDALQPRADWVADEKPTSGKHAGPADEISAWKQHLHNAGIEPAWNIAR